MRRNKFGIRKRSELHTKKEKLKRNSASKENLDLMQGGETESRKAFVWFDKQKLKKPSTQAGEVHGCYEEQSYKRLTVGRET